MEPDVTHSKPTHRPRSRVARSTDATTGPAAGISALEALSAASDSYTPNANGIRGGTRRPSLAWSAVAALIVGAAFVLAGRFEYRCGATLRCTGTSDRETMESSRKELLDYTWSALRRSADDRGKSLPASWSVDAPGPDLLRLILTRSDRRAGVEQARTLAQGYLGTMKANAARARMTPTEAEQVLSDQTERLRLRLEEVQAEVNVAAAALPTTDPRPEHQALLDEWRAQRSSFSAIRSELSQASAGLARLQSQPQPAFGVVASEERRAALEADAGLQQDLRELNVQLTELKLHLLNVWQESAGALEQLTIAVEGLVETVAGHETPDAQADVPAGEEPLLADARPYADLAQAFADMWNREFATLKRLEVNPLSGEVLDVHPRIRIRLHGFLFTAAKHLGAMRAQLAALRNGAADDARHHVLESDLTRGFRTAEVTHHRFEFIAGAIEPRDNFHLDAALQGARGLRRRTVRRIQAIEERLQANALKRARKQRTQAFARARRNVAQRRGISDQNATELVSLQDALNLNAGLTQEFLEAVLHAEVATGRLDLARDDLTRTEARLRELAAERTNAADSSRFELVSCEVLGRPTNLAERLRLGGFGALCTVVAVFLGQWWITRRA